MSAWLTKSAKPVSVRNLLVPILLLYGCAAIGQESSNANSNSTPNGMPEWMEKALNREINTPFKPTSYSIDNPEINLSLPGKVTKELADMTDSTYVQVDIGTKEDMVCEIFHAPIDPAYAISLVAENSFKHSEKILGAISNKSIFFVNSGTYKNRPYHALEWTANFGEGDKKAIVLSKFRVALIDNYGVVCQHAEFGYRDTFERAFKYVVENFEYKKTSTQPYLTEVINTSIGDRVIGFGLQTLTEDSDGDTVISFISSMLIPITNDTITTVDSTVASYSTPQGAIINSFQSSNVNGVLDYDLSLEYDSDNNNWLVNGDFKGKPFNQTLEHDGYIDSQLGHRLVIKDLAQSDSANSDTAYLWSPNLNPAEILTSTVYMDKKSELQRTVKFNLGPVKVEGLIDNNDSISEATYFNGPQVMTAKRIWTSNDL